jgi:hypothetical protein
MTCVPGLEVEDWSQALEARASSAQRFDRQLQLAVLRTSLSGSAFAFGAEPKVLVPLRPSAAQKQRMLE